jgi:transposase
MTNVSRLEVIEVGRRRRWTLEEKRRIVAESYEGLRRVSATAWRHGLSPSQLFTWRRLAREGRLGSDEETVTFAPAIIAGDPDPSPPRPDDGHPAMVPSCRSSADPAGRMEIVLGRDRRVIVDRHVDVAVLAGVIAVLERP